MKACYKCKEEKELSDFHKGKSNCKCCRKAESKIYSEKNKEKIALNRATERENKGEYLKSRRKLYRLNNKNKLYHAGKQYRLKNKERLILYGKLYADKNKEKIRNRHINYYASNRVQILLRAAEDRVINKTKNSEISARKRARKVNATPDWLSPEQILTMQDIYSLRALRSKGTCSVWHVDHIVPIAGRTVCGLHVPWNLMVITAEQNMSKGNRSWPDMWAL